MKGRIRLVNGNEREGREEGRRVASRFVGVGAGRRVAGEDKWESEERWVEENEEEENKNKNRRKNRRRGVGGRKKRRPT